MNLELHPLEKEYGLTKEELLDAINHRFRAKVTLEGVVAEIHLGKQIRALRKRGLISGFEEHDKDGYPDYSVWLLSRPDREIRIECKNVRNSEEAYRKGGVVTAFKVETQKTRASKGDRTSRFYGYDQFEILAVCLGKKTHNWKQFMFILTKDLAPSSKYKGKMAVMHPVPLPGPNIAPPWHDSLQHLLGTLEKK